MADDDGKSSRSGSDRNFDDLKDLFQERIYGTIKGNYRFDMTLSDIDKELEYSPKDSNLTALDVGGGLGQVTMSLGRNQLFSKVYYYDISSEMKCHVDQMIQKERENQTERREEHPHVSTIVTRVGGLREAIADIEQDQDEKNRTQFGPDLVCLHAVLEWLSNPMEDLKLLLDFMKPGSILSLLYYNTIAPKSSKPRRKPRKPSKLKPYHEFNHVKIEAILAENGFEITRRTGLRVRKFQRDGSEKEMNKYLEEERKIARVEPYCRQGRYNHIVAVKKTDTYE